MNKVSKNKQNVGAALKGLSSSLLLLLFFFLVSIAVPLPGRGQDTPSPSREAIQPQEPEPDRSEVIEEESFLILKERLDRLSAQITKHKRSSSPGIPEYVEKEDLDLPPFPEMSEDDAIEDSLLMLKKRLESLHHLLQQES